MVMIQQLCKNSPLSEDKLSRDQTEETSFVHCLNCPTCPWLTNGRTCGSRSCCCRIIASICPQLLTREMEQYPPNILWPSHIHWDHRNTTGQWMVQPPCP